MVLTIITISSLLLSGTFIYLYNKEVNKKKDIEAKYQATEKFAEEAGSTILKLQTEKKELQNTLALSQARNTIAKTAERAVEKLEASRPVVAGEEKPKARRGRRKKPAANKD